MSGFFGGPGDRIFVCLDDCAIPHNSRTIAISIQALYSDIAGFHVCSHISKFKIAFHSEALVSSDYKNGC